MVAIDAAVRSIGDEDLSTMGLQRRSTAQRVGRGNPP